MQLTRVLDASKAFLILNEIKGDIMVWHKVWTWNKRVNGQNDEQPLDPEVFFHTFLEVPLFKRQYRPAGVQYRTKNGYACETWGSGVAASYTSTTYSTLVGANNYCRNPYLAALLVRKTWKDMECEGSGGDIHTPYML